MPNWCSNSIIIEGPADKIRALWDAAKANEDGFLLEAMAPIGEWDYNRAVETWGTKWDLSDEGLDFVDNGDGRAQIAGWADSAWSPPIEAFQSYANANDDCYLEIRYFEPGMSFIGVWDNEGGDAYWEDVGQLVESKADEEDDVIAELFEQFNVWDYYEDEEDEEEVDELDESETSDESK
jgi:hypothetical protein